MIWLSGRTTMNWFCTLTRIAMSLLALACAAPAGDAYGQAVKELVGSWTLISVKVDQGGQMVEPFGANPKGALMFDRNGRFSIVISRSDLPKITSNNRMAGTEEENKAIVHGSIAYFGTYTVSAEDRLFIFHIEGGTFPNWVGTDQKRIFSITGDELKYTNLNRSAGAGTALVVWKRVK
jgi:hypothetical protein